MKPCMAKAMQESHCRFERTQDHRVISFQHIESYLPSGDDQFGVGGTPERLRLFTVVLINEVVDGRLSLGD